MSAPRFKVARLHWWNKPVRLVKRGDKGSFDQIGWVWNQRAYLVNNLSHGWIAFVEDQTPENIDIWFCDHCGGPLWGSRRSKIEDSIKSKKVATNDD